MKFQVDSAWCWLQAVAAFLFHAVFFGLVFSFGIFYVALLQDFPGQETEVAWIAGINFGVLMLISPLTIRVLDRIPARVVCCTGTLLASLGLYLASKATSTLVLYVTFGIMHGIGNNLCYMSSIWVLRKNFHRHSGLAFGLSSAGSGAGGIIFGIMLPIFVESRGWRGALEIVSYITLSFVLVAMVMVPVRQESEKVEKKSLLPWKQKLNGVRVSVPSPWRNRAFLVLSVAILLCAFVSSMPYCHIVNYAIFQGVSRTDGDRLPFFISVGSLVGRIVVGKILGSGRVSRIGLCQITFLVQCAATTFCTLATNTAGLVSFCLVFGAFDGVFSVLLAIVVDDVFLDKNQALQAMGQLFQLLAIPYAFGAPLAGWLYAQAGSYHVVFFFCGGILFIAAALISLVRHLLRPALDTPVLALPEKIVVSPGDENSGDFTPGSNRLINSRACSFIDLAIEVYGEKRNTFISSTNLSVHPKTTQHLEIGRLEMVSRQKHIVGSQDFSSAATVGDCYGYTDITNQISGHGCPLTNHNAEPSEDVDNHDVISVDCHVSDTCSLDDADDVLQHGSSGISIDDAGYCSAPAPANFVDSDAQSLTSQTDVSMSVCSKEGSLDSFIEIDFVEDEKVETTKDFCAGQENAEHFVLDLATS